MNSVKWHVFLSLASIAISGCGKLTSPVSKMNEVSALAPSNWSASKHARGGVDRAWVSRFGDAKLTRFVNEAIASNPDMRVVSERVLQAQQAAYMAGASGRIKSSAGIDARRRKTVFVGLPFRGSQISNTYGIDWMVNWEPDIWGRVRAGVAASVAEFQAVKLERNAAESSLAARVCKAWFSLCEANEQYQLASQAHHVRVKVLDSIRGKFDLALAGEGGGASDLRLAETDVATSLAAKAQRSGEVDAAKRQLQLLLGRYPSAAVSAGVRLPRIPSRPPAGLPSELLMRRPDVLAAERKYAATGSRVIEARRAIYPSFKLTGSTGTTTDQLSEILNSQFGVWSLGANISQQILTGGQVRGELKIRKSKQRQSLAELHATVLKAFGEVETALASDKWLSKRIREMQKALKLATNAASAAEQDFAEGNTSALSVLTAQTRKIDIASTVVVLRRLQLDNRVNLHLALGGEFRPQGK